nr:pentapeptide repeat-containing protein [Sporolactobacillus terrae]
MNHETAQNSRKRLTADCSKCFGLCCTALNMIASSDFPINKAAGTPCDHLQSNYACRIHRNLREKGFKGCTVYDCLGAGQFVSQITFKGQNWRDHPKLGTIMFQVFPVMEQIHEMIAYTVEALSYDLPHALTDKLSSQLKKLRDITKCEAEYLLSLDLVKLRAPLNELLTKISASVRANYIEKLPTPKSYEEYDHGGSDWIGKQLSGKDLRAFHFRGAYLIAADLRHADLRAVDFIGADLRDADLSGANLMTSMFLTQMQINSAKGNVKTILPFYIQRPLHWSH